MAAGPHETSIPSSAAPGRRHRQGSWNDGQAREANLLRPPVRAARGLPRAGTRRHEERHLDRDDARARRATPRAAVVAVDRDDRAARPGKLTRGLWVAG